MRIQKNATFPGRLDSLPAIVELAVEAAETACLNARAIYGVQLAMEEACSNIIKHAYQGQGNGDIECTFVIEQHKLTMILRDYGRPFDPDSIPPPDISARLEERGLGGLGLYFMRQLMDVIHFEFTSDSGNILTMVKCKEPSFEEEELTC
jgi:anti-sigma regulatory factor (Ser/Thr protein kinase)